MDGSMDGRTDGFICVCVYIKSKYDMKSFTE